MKLDSEDKELFFFFLYKLCLFVCISYSTVMFYYNIRGGNFRGNCPLYVIIIIIIY